MALSCKVFGVHQVGIANILGILRKTENCASVCTRTFLRRKRLQTLAELLRSFRRTFRRTLAEDIVSQCLSNRNIVPPLLQSRQYKHTGGLTRRNDYPSATQDAEKVCPVNMVDGQGTTAHTTMLAPALSDIGMIELLECDSRPTFILDLEGVQHVSEEVLHSVFSNASLKRLPRILYPAHVKGGDELEQYLDFKEWATRSPTYRQTAEGFTNPYSYQDISWTCSTLRERWRIISGSAIGPKDTSAGLVIGHTAGSQKDRQGAGNALRNTQEEEGKLQTGLHPAWVDELPSSEHTKLFKTTNWAATALGSLENWSSCLRQMTRLLMSDSRAAAMFWYRPVIK